VADITGTPGDDIIVGTADADNIDGGAGKDRINGGDGDDVAHGGEGNDYVYGDGGNDKLFGDAGNDTLVGHSGNDEMHGGAGNDGFFGGGNDDLMLGEAGTDTMFGDGGNDTMNGGADNDRLFGGSGNDTLIYTIGEGVDELVGNRGSDTLRLEMTSDQLAAMRPEIIDFHNWMENQVAQAGGESAHAGLNTGEVYTFASTGLQVSAVEQIELIIDGQTIPYDSILNQAPTLDATQNIAMYEDGTIQGQVAAVDPDGDTLTYTLIDEPDNGQVSLDSQTGDFKYAPTGDYSGADQFTVTVTDPDGASAQQIVQLDISPVADAPTLAVADPNPVGASFDGTSGADTIVGTTGNDVISGGAGNDIINADPKSGTFVADLDITAGLTDVDGSETLSVSISGVPDDANLSAGTSQGNGVWDLTPGDLSGLQLKYEGGADINLTVSATATESNGDTSTVSQDITIEGAQSGGDDIIIGGAGNDIIDGGAGTDIVDFSSAQGGVHVDLNAGFALGEGFDHFTNIEGVTGGNSGDLIIGNSADNILDGGAGNDGVYAGGGNDVVIANAGNDRYDGGSGNDTVDFSNASSGVEVDLNKGRASGAETGHDHIRNFENVTGSLGDDHITGSRGDNVLIGGAGADQIRGGRGADTLTGGTGDDIFSFHKSDVVSGRRHHGVDNITDFGSGDRLDFSNLLHGVNYDALSDVVHLTETNSGTLLSVEMNGSAGLTDVVFLDGVFDLNLDFLDGDSHLIV